MLSYITSDPRKNELTTLPNSLGNLTALTSLRLDGNQLTTLPDSLASLTALTTLDLNSNQLTTLPDWLGNLTGLTSLRAGSNQLATLPDSLGNLTALTTLDLDSNKLASLPHWLGNLTGLAILGLNDNQLAILPDSLGNLTALTALNLRANPLRSPLREIAEDGTPAVKAYLALISQSAAELWMSKLLVVGEGFAGKTSLVRALCGQKHNPDEPTTHGIRIAEVKLSHPDNPSVQMRLSSWDFGGQDIYHATHQFFLTDRSLFLLLWNARQGWEHAKVPYWLDIIKARAPHARVILVATHADGRPVDLPLTDLKARHPQIVDSCSVDNRAREGIEELRTIMAREAAKLPLMGSQWPTTWLAGVEAINRSTRKYATPEALYKKLAKAGVTDRSHQAYLLRALHVLGEILFFEDDEELRDTIILRPQWINDYIAKVLDSPQVLDEHGVLSRAHERQLWANLDPGLRDRFLRMMERFDLSYRIADDATAASLVVECLPWEPPPYQERWDEVLANPGAREIRLRYELDTLPPGVPTWFIAREHRFTTGTHWRTGALLAQPSDPPVLGLIRGELQKNTVDLSARGPVPQNFFSILQDGFESTLKRYQGLEVKRMVPCLCNYGDGTQPGQPCVYMHDYESLLRRLTQAGDKPGVLEAECGRSFLKVSVTELLFGLAPTTIEQLVAKTDAISQDLRALRAEVALVHRQFLKQLRQAQARAEAVCPSVFTLIPVKSRKPGFKRLELRLYCEQPGAFHAPPAPPYIIDEPARWLTKIAPYLGILLAILKHAVPLAGPALGVASDKLFEQLEAETELMTEVVSQLPEVVGKAQPDADELRQGNLLEADYRALQALLEELDPKKRWAGLSKTDTPEDDVLWLCRDHAQQYRG